jgi:hypothetical protein
LRYSIHFTDEYKASLTKYDKKAKEIKTYTDSHPYAESYWNPHEMFKPLDRIVESSYSMQEDE